MKAPLEHWIREAREDLGKHPLPQIDWDAVDDKLFKRIDALKKAERARFHVGPNRAWVATGAALAAAVAVIALVFGRPAERMPLATGPTGHAVEGNGGETVGQLTDVAPGGRVFLRGSPVQQGAAIAVGDVIEARGGDAYVESPGRVRLIVENGSRVRVTKRGGPLVVSLESGAVEADVNTVARGEAFAVDVDRARVAVHGTHFRVSRSGGEAQIDLNEGVVVVGEAPRSGDVIGALVAAPAHVEFSLANVAASLTVDHDAAAVRPRAPWPGAVAEAEPTAVYGPRPVEHASDPAGARASLAPHVVESRAASSSASAPMGAASSAAPSTSAAPVAPEEAVSSAVRACMSDRPRADNVTVLVRTTLDLDVGDDGLVRGARFDPPVLPEVNTCAAPTIYRVRFPRGGSVSIPIDFKN
jgi:ferric-dicitrate binding protein FerR (iron transport regulator)